MKFRELFDAPERENITEKYLYKVLITSICSILLCMGCLAGTTWAWFIVSVENPNNVIQIEMPSVIVTSIESEVTEDGEVITETKLDSGMLLPAGVYELCVTDARGAEDRVTDVFGQASTLYVTFSVEETNVGYVTLYEGNEYTETITVDTNHECTVKWYITWKEPEDLDLLTDYGISWYVTVEETSEEVTDLTEIGETEAEEPEEITEDSAIAETEGETEPTEWEIIDEITQT